MYNPDVDERTRGLVGDGKYHINMHLGMLHIKHTDSESPDLI